MMPIAWPFAAVAMSLATGDLGRTGEDIGVARVPASSAAVSDEARALSAHVIRVAWALGTVGVTLSSPSDHVRLRLGPHYPPPRDFTDQQIIDALGGMIADEDGLYATASYQLLRSGSRRAEKVTLLRSGIPF